MLSCSKIAVTDSLKLTIAVGLMEAGGRAWIVCVRQDVGLSRWKGLGKAIHYVGGGVDRGNVGSRRVRLRKSVGQCGDMDGPYAC